MAAPQDRGSWFAFATFADHESANKALHALNGTPLLGMEMRVNWALPMNHKDDKSKHYHVFVGDLAPSVTDAILYNTFCAVKHIS